MTRVIKFYNKNFIEFYLGQDKKVQEKIDYVLMLIRTVEHVPERFLKHIRGTNGLYEIRVKHGKGSFRIFCCFDRDQLVVLFNAFRKKTAKTPRQEIEKALKLMKNYFDEKKR